MESPDDVNTPSRCPMYMANTDCNSSANQDHASNSSNQLDTTESLTALNCDLTHHIESESIYRLDSDFSSPPLELDSDVFELGFDSSYPLESAVLLNGSDPMMSEALHNNSRRKDLDHTYYSSCISENPENIQILADTQTNSADLLDSLLDRQSAKSEPHHRPYSKTYSSGNLSTSSSGSTANIIIQTSGITAVSLPTAASQRHGKRLTPDPQSVMVVSSRKQQSEVSPRSLLHQPIKQEPTLHTQDACEWEAIDSIITPPSSTPNSDNEGSVSPSRADTVDTKSLRQILIARPSNQKYYNSSAATLHYSQPIPTRGSLLLTDEERRMYSSEGYPLPNRLPLSKLEERNLKKIRRKIKNKISAQESRRKKKEYMDHLEQRVELIVKENDDLKRKCESFETSNRSLISQLNRLQTLIKRVTPSRHIVTRQSATCVAVLVLCFAVFLGDLFPFCDLISTSLLQTSSHLSSHTNSHKHMLHPSTSQSPSSRTLMSWPSSEDGSATLYLEEPWVIWVGKTSVDVVKELLLSARHFLMSS